MLSRLAGVSEAGAGWRNPEPALIKEAREGTLIHVHRLSIALVCYGVLGALAWTTLTDPKFRVGTLLILALLAVKSVLRRNDVLHADKDAE
jgi:hypothetical protein